MANDLQNQGVCRLMLDGKTFVALTEGGGYVWGVPATHSPYPSGGSQWL